MKVIRLFGLALVLVCMTLMIASCGKSNSSTPAAADTTTVTGSVYAAPVDGSSVIVKDDSGTIVAGPVTTASDGAYTIGIPTSALSINLRIEATGGTFIDEATGTTTTAGRLSAYTEGGTLSAGSAVHLDPSSTVVHDLVTYGSGTSVSGAKSLFTSAFGYIPDTTVAPMNTAPTGTTNAPNRLAALRAAAFSQLAKDMGLTPGQQFDLMVAIAHDLADDGKLNGSAAAVNGTSIPEDILNKFEVALTTFMSDTVHNHTGLTTAEIGSLPFGRVVLTHTYRVEYIPGMMAAAQGKTSFKIKITKRSDDSAATGLMLKLMPMMHMATMSHSTPTDTIIDDGDGTYSCNAYYLMASGPGMGFWDLKVMIGSGMTGETATFYPAVGMAMGSTTVRASLKGVTDMILSSPTGTATEKRTYYLFNDGLMSSMSSYTFNLFIATKESMMSYPAVGTGSTLINEQNASWVVNPVTVDASIDKATWFPATEGAVAGHWSIVNLTGLSSGQTGTIYVRMNVNNEIKTTNGSMVTSPTGTNGYATFTVTPAASGM